MKITYFHLSESFKRLRAFHEKIKINKVFYTPRTTKALNDFMAVLPADAPVPLCETLGKAWLLHTEMEKKGRCACRTHWAEVQRLLTYAQTLIDQWIGAVKVNPATSNMEKALLKEILSDEESMPSAEILASATPGEVQRVTDISKIFGQSNGGEQAITSQPMSPEEQAKRYRELMEAEENKFNQEQ